MQLKIWNIIVLLGAILMLASCSKNDKNIISMEEYIENNNITLTRTTPNGVGVVIDVQGTGRPASNAQVLVNYRGLLTNGSEFDSGNDVSFNLSGVIPGWTEGIPEFGKGGSGTLYIPSGLGYGAFGAGNDIPPNADLIFEVDLIDFN